MLLLMKYHILEYLVYHYISASTVWFFHRTGCRMDTIYEHTPPVPSSSHVLQNVEHENNGFRRSEWLGRRCCYSYS